MYTSDDGLSGTFINDTGWFTGERAEANLAGDRGRIEKVAAVTDELRPEVAALVHRHRHHGATLGRDPRESAWSAREEDDAVGVPGRAGHRRDMRRNGVDATIRHAHLEESVATEEADPRAVGRPEGGVGVLGARDFDGSAGGRVERPNPQSLDAVAPDCDVCKAAPVWSEREWHIEAGGIRRIALRPQLKAEIGCR